MTELTTSEKSTVEQDVIPSGPDLESYLIVDEAAKAREDNAKYWNAINISLCLQLRRPLVD
jgi:hypothetical protein